MKNQQDSNRKPHLFSAEPTLDMTPGFPLITLEMLASLLDFSPDALLIIDTTGTIVLLNTQMEMLFGYGQEELIGQSLETLLPERLRATHVVHHLPYMTFPRPHPTR